MSLKILTKASGSVTLTSKEEVGTWVRGLDEDETITVLCNLIRFNAYEEFYRLMRYGLCLTDKVIQSLCSKLQEYPSKRQKFEMLFEQFRFGSYTSFGVRLAIFGVFFGILGNPLPKGDYILRSTMKARVKTSRFDPIYFLCEWNDEEMMKWILEVMKVEGENKEQYLEKARELGSNKLYDILS